MIRSLENLMIVLKPACDNFHSLMALGVPNTTVPALVGDISNPLPRPNGSGGGGGGDCCPFRPAPSHALQLQLINLVAIPLQMLGIIMGMR